MKKKLIFALVVIIAVLAICLVACENNEQPNLDPVAEKVTVTISGGTGSGTYDKGAEVTATAQNKGDGYTFKGWYLGEDFVSAQNPYTFTATRDITLTATYDYDEYYYLSAGEKGDNTNGSKVYVPRNVDDDLKEFDHWPTVVSDDTSVYAPGGSEKSTKIVISPTLDEEGDPISENPSSTSYGGVWSTVDFTLLKTVNAFDYAYVEYDIKLDNAQMWTSIRIGDEKLSTEFGTDAECTMTRISADNWYHCSYKVALHYQYERLQDEESELSIQEEDNYIALANAKIIRIAVSNSHSDQKQPSVIHIDNLRFVNEPQQVQEYVLSKYTVTAVDGTIADATIDDKYTEGTTIVITANQKAHKVFAGWSNGTEIVSTDATYSYVVSGDATFTATYSDIMHTVTVVGGTISPVAENDSYVEGSSVTLTAPAVQGKYFTGWKVGEEVVSTSNPYTFEVAEDITLTAQYGEEDPNKTYYDVVVKADGETPVTSRVEENTVIDLTPASKTGYRFDKWVDGNEQDVTVAEGKYTVTADITIVAKFVQQFTVTVVKGTGGGTYDINTEITITADATSLGYEYAGWKLGEDSTIVNTESSITFNVTADVTYTAVFNAIEGEESDLLTSADATASQEATIYLAKETGKDGQETVLRVLTAKSGNSYPYITITPDALDMYLNTMTFDIKFVGNGHPWVSVRFLDANGTQVGKRELDISKNTWTTISCDTPMQNVASIKFIFTVDGQPDLMVYLDNMVFTARPSVHPFQTSYAAGSDVNTEFTALDTTTGEYNAVYFEFYIGDGAPESTVTLTLMDNWDNYSNNFKIWIDGGSNKGKVVATEDAGWYGITILLSECNGDGTNKNKFDRLYGGKNGINFDLKVDYTTMKLVNCPVVTVVSGTKNGNVYANGQSVTVTADEVAHKSFVGWSDGEEVISFENTYTFTVNGNITLTATYEDIMWQVTVEGGTIEPTAGEDGFVDGTSVKVTATEQSGKFFTGWSDGEKVVSTLNPYTFEVTAAITLTAQFSAQDPNKTYYTVTVKADGETGVNNVVEEGNTITLTPSSKQGYRFDKWVDGNDQDVTVTEGEYTVTGDITLVAKFVQQFTVTVVNGTPASQVVDINATPTIVADDPQTGYTFAGWTKGTDTTVISTDVSYTTAAITADTTYTATYEVIPVARDEVAITQGTEFRKKLTNIILLSEVENKALYFEFKPGTGADESTITFTFMDDWQNVSGNFKIWIDGGTNKGTKVALANGWFGYTIPYASLNGDGKDIFQIDYIYSGNPGYNGTIDMDSIKVVRDEITFAQGTDIQFNLANPINLTDLEGKSIYFEYKMGEGTGDRCDMALMDDKKGWANVSGYMRFWKSGNVKVDDVSIASVELADGWRGVAIPYEDFFGDGKTTATVIDLIYGGGGSNLYEITFDKGSFRVLDRPNTKTYLKDSGQFTFNDCFSVSMADLDGKCLYFEYRIESPKVDANVTVNFMNSDWKNASGEIKLNGKGTCNKTGTVVVYLGVGWYGIYVPLTSFDGGDKTIVETISMCHCKWGPNYNITFDIDSICVKELPTA